MNRCKKCILPENYCNISFDNDGICNFCNGTENKLAINYLGNEALIDTIRLFQSRMANININYDCLIPLSGGRDSTYLLYYFSKILNMKCLALTVDNGFITPQAWENIHKTVEILNVKLVVAKNPNLKKLFKHHIKSWMHHPSAGTIGFLCVGCYYPVVSEIFRTVKKYQVPVIIWGVTPFEHGSYKYDLFRYWPQKQTHLSYVLGYIYQILKNPLLIAKPSGLVMQFKEYLNSYYLNNRTSNNKK